MKKIILFGIAIFSLAVSCTSTIKENVEISDTQGSTATTEVISNTEEELEEEAEIEFDGIQKETGKLFGHTDFDATTSTSITAMLTEFEEAGSFNGAVDVKINEVCQNAGCWINFQKDDTSGETIMVFFRDHYTIPIEESNGKNAILYGTLNSDTLTVDFQKHLLDDAAANGEEVSQEEYDAITEDKIDVTFDCESILIKD